MESNLFGVDLLTNKKKKYNTSKQIINNQLISENYSPIVLDKIIKDMTENLSQLIKYRYQIKSDNEKLVKDILDELVNDILKDQKLIEYANNLINH